MTTIIFIGLPLKTDRWRFCGGASRNIDSVNREDHPRLAGCAPVIFHLRKGNGLGGDLQSGRGGRLEDALDCSKECRQRYALRPAPHEPNPRRTQTCTRLIYTVVSACGADVHETNGSGILYTLCDRSDYRSCTCAPQVVDNYVNAVCELPHQGLFVSSRPKRVKGAQRERDCYVGTQCLHFLEFVLVARGRNNLRRSEIFRQAHSQPPCGPCRAVDQDCFTSFEAGTFHHCRPRGHSRVSDRGCRDVVYVIGQWNAMLCLDERFLRERTKWSFREDEVHALSFGCAPHAIAPGDRRKLALCTVVGA